MRISTSTFYNESTSTMNQLQSSLAQTNQQISTGKRILTPADDPVASARLVELSQSDSANTQYGANRTAAMNVLTLADGIMQGATQALVEAKTLAFSAGSGTFKDADRKSLAYDLQAKYDELLGLANSSDGQGNYLFSGSQGGVQPFVTTAAGVSYQGDDVQRRVQASASRQIATSDSGADIFMRVKNGNGTFQANPAAGNTGSGTISQGAVINPALYNGNSYRISFGAGGTTYSVTDMTVPAPVPAAVLPTNVPYVSGQAISFQGVQVEIKGAPAAGDTFDIAPSTNESVFTTLKNLITALNTPLVGNATANAAFQQQISTALGGLDKSLNNVLGVRATLGSRMREIDAMQNTGDELSLHYKKTISQIQDTDLAKAISDFTQQQMLLQAAQKTFSQVSQLSLFNYLR